MEGNPRAELSDQLVTMRLGWSDFERFLSIRGESLSPRITYLDGVLELMSPSKSHEGIKSRIVRLLELWAALEGIAVSPFGSTTLKKRRGKAVARRVLRRRSLRDGLGAGHRGRGELESLRYR